MARANTTPIVDRSLSSKFIFHHCCPGHDLFGRYSQDAPHGSKVRSRQIKFLHRMSRRILKNLLNIELKKLEM